MTNDRLQIDHRPPTTDHRPPTTDHRPPTTDHRQLTTRRKHANTLARPSLRLANAAATAGIYVNCRPGVGVRDWSEHGDFQRGERDFVASAELFGLRAVGHD